MSEISVSRSVPALWMVRANSICWSVSLLSGLSMSSFYRISNEFSGVRSSWLMFASNSLLLLLDSANCSARSSRLRRARSISAFLT